VHFLVQLPIWASALLVLGPLLALTGYFAARRSVPVAEYVQNEPKNKTVEHWVRLGGSTITILIGFVFVQMWNSYKDADRGVSREADVLMGLAFFAQALPERDRQATSVASAAYARRVLDEEWPVMQAGGSDPRAEAELRRLEDLYAAMEVRGVKPEQAYVRSLELVPELRRLHTERLARANGSIPSFMYVLLLFGLFVIVVWALVFRGAKGTAYVAGTVLSVALPATVLYCILLLDFPFAGNLSVSGTAIRTALKRIEGEPGAPVAPSVGR
jgi:heme/copper-type cytochrome/quinol oxidase subunit 2